MGKIKRVERTIDRNETTLRGQVKINDQYQNITLYNDSKTVHYSFNYQDE